MAQGAPQGLCGERDGRLTSDIHQHVRECRRMSSCQGTRKGGSAQMAKVCPTRRGGVPGGRPSQAEQMLGAARSGRRVWKSSWVGGARPTGQGVQKEQQHLGLTRVRCFQDHKELLPAHTRGTPGLGGPHSPTAESGLNRAGGLGPAKAGHSPVIRHHDGVERVLIPGHCGRPTRLCPRDAPPGVAAAKPAAARLR